MSRTGLSRTGLSRAWMSRMWTSGGPGSVMMVSLLLLHCGWGQAAEPTRREWTIDGTRREALIAAPPSAKQQPAPVVFAFHGHGGTMQHAARTFAYHTHWPEAIVVYPQGLPTPGRLTDPAGKKPGWQPEPGSQGDRDLKFFDAVLATLQADYTVDRARIYCTGHSNGGGFTYLLWHERPEVFAAVAPSGAAAGRKYSNFKPKPVLHIAGQHDELVKFAWQELMISRLKQINQVDSTGQPWHDVKHATVYGATRSTPVVTYIYPGGHTFPAQEAAPLVVKFFKEHRQSDRK